MDHVLNPGHEFQELQTVQHFLRLTVEIAFAAQSAHTQHINLIHNTRFFTLILYLRRLATDAPSIWHKRDNIISYDTFIKRTLF